MTDREMQDNSSTLDESAERAGTPAPLLEAGSPPVPAGQRIPSTDPEADAKAEAICEDVAGGAPTDRACDARGVAPPTFRRWVRGKPELAELYRAAMAERAMRYAEEIVSIADGDGELDAETRAAIELAATYSDKLAEKTIRAALNARVMRDTLRVRAREWVASRLMAPATREQKVSHTIRVVFDELNLPGEVTALPSTPEEPSTIPDAEYEVETDPLD